MKYPVILKAFISKHLLSLLDVIVFFFYFQVQNEDLLFFSPFHYCMFSVFISVFAFC